MLLPPPRLMLIDPPPRIPPPPRKPPPPKPRASTSEAAKTRVASNALDHANPNHADFSGFRLLLTRTPIPTPPGLREGRSRRAKRQLAAANHRDYSRMESCSMLTTAMGRKRSLASPHSEHPSACFVFSRTGSQGEM